MIGRIVIEEGFDDNGPFVELSEMPERPFTLVQCIPFWFWCASWFLWIEILTEGMKR